MGFGNFFDNFIGGFAFGMLTNNPLFRGMNNWGFGCCCSFPMLNVGVNSNFDPIFDESYSNSFPKNIDFTGVKQSIWDNVINMNSEYNKRMEEWYSKTEENNQCKQTLNNTNYSNLQYSMPFSPYYFPYTEFSYMPPYSQTQRKIETHKEQAVEKKSEIKQEVKTENNKIILPTEIDDIEPTETDLKQIKNTKLNYDVTALKAKWSKKKNLPDAFYEKVISISKKIKCDPNDLMGVMWYETEHTFSPSSKNPHSSATGLIQFTSDTASKLGTTIPKLKAMTAVEQLDYVEKYLVRNKEYAGYNNNQTLDRGTLYSLVFLPGRSKRKVLTSKGEEYYEKNKKNLDYNHDGKITKSDLHSVITANMS